jgi:hypothetical protein
MKVNILGFISIMQIQLIFFHFYKLICPSLQIPWCMAAMQGYIQKAIRQIDELNEQQISVVALFLAIAGASGGEKGRQLLESIFSCLPASSCALCMGSATLCILYLQVLKFLCGCFISSQQSTEPSSIIHSYVP